MKEIGSAEKQEVGRWANNWVVNSHLPFRRRERAMARFRCTHTLQKFSAVHASFHDHFALEPHLRRPRDSKPTAPPPWRRGKPSPPEPRPGGGGPPLAETRRRWSDSTAKRSPHLAPLPGMPPILPRVRLALTRPQLDPAPTHPCNPILGGLRLCAGLPSAVSLQQGSKQASPFESASPSVAFG